jgi:hypothetical protein
MTESLTAAEVSGKDAENQKADSFDKILDDVTKTVVVGGLAAAAVGIGIIALSEVLGEKK